MRSIIESIQNSAEGWRMFFGGGMQNSAQKSEIGSALIGGGFAAAQQRYAGIKAGGVSVVSAQATAPVGVRYMSASRTLLPPPVGEGRGEGTQYDPGTPATVIETIQKSIGESAEGWRMGYAHVACKARENIVVATIQEKIGESLAGWQWGISEAGSKVSESFGNVGSGIGEAFGGVGEWFGNVGKGISSMQWLLYIIVFVLIFVAIMTSIGYSGVGGPAARVAEREYVKRR